MADTSSFKPAYEADVNKTRVYVKTTEGIHVEEFDDPEVGYGFFLSIPHNVPAAHRSAGDTLEVLAHDFLAN
jgi:hypothetical protein